MIQKCVESWAKWGSMSLGWSRERNNVECFIYYRKLFRGSHYYFHFTDEETETQIS